MKTLNSLASAAAVLLVAATAACTPSPQESPTNSATGSAAGTGSVGGVTAAPAANLQRFYDQKISWQPCGDDQCGKLEVPIDYAKPEAGSIKLALLRHKSPSKNRQGSLVINPGGPGGSGVQYAQYASAIFPGEVTRAYDVVGFDPRGVAASQPIVCYDGPQFDAFLSVDPTPDDPAEEQQLATADRDFGQACEQRNKALLGHVSTVEAAKDMDVLRAALGDQKLNFFGASYGTFLGATFADQFPKRVGRFILDGAIDPSLDGKAQALGQAEGFERATQAYIADCITKSDCPLGNEQKAATKRLQDFLTELDQKPIPAGEGAPGKLNEAWASYGVAASMYDPGRWAGLTQSLSEAFRGDGTNLMLSAEEYVERTDNGTYSGNMLQVINAVSCLDNQGDPNLASYPKTAAEFAAKAPTFGKYMAWGGLVCGEWPIKATGKAHRITAPGADPIVVIGTTRDPATPYEGAVALAGMLDSGVLVSRDGDGHTGYGRGNNCVDKAVNDYLVRGKAPADGIKC